MTDMKRYTATIYVEFETHREVSKADAWTIIKDWLYADIEHGECTNFQLFEDELTIKELKSK